MADSKVVSSLKIPQPDITEPVIVTRDDMTRLLFETHKKCANAAEEVMSIREIAKINDLYPKANDSVQINLHAVVHTMDKLQGMGDQQLIEMMGGDEQLFAMPKPTRVDDDIEGVFVEIEDNTDG